MTTTIRSNADGSKSYIQVGGTDVVTLGTQGIEAGSYAPGSIEAGSYAPGSIGATELSNTALLGTSAKPIGYSAGGTVTQATSKSTAVTLNKPTGRITMNVDALAAATTVSFTFNNSLLAANDVVAVSMTGPGNGFLYNVWVSKVAAGSCIVNVRNIHAASLSEAIQINFAIIRGATS